MRRLTQSEMKDYRKCKRMWWLKWVRKYKRTRFTPSAFSQGILFHEGMEHRRNPDPDAWRNAVMAKHQEFLESCDEIDHKDLQKQLDLAVIMIEGMLEWIDEEGIDVGIEVIEAEREVQIVLNDEVILMGKWDEYIRDLQTGQTGFRDYKTAANWSIFKLSELDEQFLIYEVIRREDDSDSVGSWGEWLVAKKVKRTAAAKPPFYDRHRRVFNDIQVNNMRTRVLALGRDMQRDIDHLELGHSHQVVVPPSPSHECPRCPYFMVCAMHDDGSAVDETLERFYTIKSQHDGRYAPQQGETE